MSVEAKEFFSYDSDDSDDQNKDVGSIGGDRTAEVDGDDVVNCNAPVDKNRNSMSSETEIDKKCIPTGPSGDSKKFPDVKINVNETEVIKPNSSQTETVKNVDPVKTVECSTSPTSLDDENTKTCSRGSEVTQSSAQRDEQKNASVVSINFNFEKYKLLDNLIKLQSPLLNALLAEIKSSSFKDKTLTLEVSPKSNKYTNDLFKNSIYELAMDWEVTIIPVSQDQMDYLSFHSDYLTSFGERPLGADSRGDQIYAVIYLNDAKLRLTATCQEGVSLAKNKLDADMFCENIILSNEDKKLLSTEIWEEFKKKEINSLHVEVKQVNDNQMKVVVVGKKESVSEFKLKMEEFVRKNSVVVEKINTNQEVVKLLQDHHKEEIMRRSKDVSIKFNNASIEIRGLREIVNEESKRISDMTRKIVHKSFEVEQAGLKAELFTKEENEAKSFLNKVMKEKKCHVTVTERVEYKDEKKGYSWLALSRALSFFSSKEAANTDQNNSQPVQNVAVSDSVDDDGDYDNDDDDDDGDDSDDDQAVVEEEEDDIPEVVSNSPASGISVVAGSIVDCKNADILVHAFSSRKGDLSRRGAISKAFLKSGGDQLQQEFFSNDIPSKFGSAPMVTRSFSNLQAKWIFHSYISSNKNRHSSELMKETILHCLKKAIELQCQSIAFPTMGCGKLGYSVEEISNCFYKAEREFNSSKNLKIYIFCFEGSLISRFNGSLSQGSRASFPQRRSSPRKKSRTERRPRTKKSRRPPRAERGFEVEAQNDHKIVIFTVFSMSEDCFTSAEESIKLGVKNLCIEDKLKHEMVEYLQSLSKDSYDKLSALPLANFCVKMEKDNKNELFLSGLRSDMYRIKDQIRQILDEEKEQRRNPAYVKKHFGPKPYLKLLATSEDLTLPHYWKKYKKIEMGEMQTPVKSPLDKNSVIYKAIEELVMKTWDPTKAGGLGKDARNLTHNYIEISKIYVVENPKLFIEYDQAQKVLCHVALQRDQQLKKLADQKEKRVMTKGKSSEMDKYLISEINEYFLFHGTKTDIVDSILNRGIDFRLCSENAMFGRGAYFAESSTKADQYTDPREGRTALGTTLTMFLARVLLGDSYVCKRPFRFKKPPCIEPGCGKAENCTEGSHRVANSVVGLNRDDGTPLLFREFVVYDVRENYPEFLIEYVRK